MHKESCFPRSELFRVVIAGRKLSTELIPDIEGDDTGENISSKNRSFCELTALYWAWKNLPLPDYVGLCHYRRYFSLASTYSVITSQQMSCVESVGMQQFEQIFESCDIVVVEPTVLKCSLTTHYEQNHDGDDLVVLRQVISNIYPDYLSSYDAVMSSNKLSPYNMFIAPADRFCHYCEWLFATLFELERLTDIATRNSSQQRIYGYVAERLLNIYIHHHKLRRRYLPIYLVDGFDSFRKVVAGQSRFTRFKHNFIFTFFNK